MSLDFTFLDKTQINSKKLPFFSSESFFAHPTDFAILLGVEVGNDKDSTDKLCSWWTKSGNYADALALGISYKNMPYYYFFYERYVGARPCVALSSLPVIASGNEVLFGEYPQTVVDKKTATKLEKLYKKNDLIKTGKKYTTDSIEVVDTTTPFTPVEHIEYEFEGKKYIRFESNKNGKGVLLSDGTKVKSKKIFWLLIEPIVWLVDKEHDIALSKNVLFSGIQIGKHNSKISSFKRSVIKKFLDNHFSKEIVVENEESIKHSPETDELKPVEIMDHFVDDDIIEIVIEENIEDIIKEIYEHIKETLYYDDYLMKINEIVNNYIKKLSEGIITTDKIILDTKDELKRLKEEIISLKNKASD